MITVIVTIAVALITLGAAIYFSKQIFKPAQEAREAREREEAASRNCLVPDIWAEIDVARLKYEIHQREIGEIFQG